MSDVNIWAIVPAAGIGSRFGSAVPKQYAQLNNQTVLEQSVKALLQWQNFNAVIVALADNDIYWQKTSLNDEKKVHTVAGGVQRMHSVLNALNYLETFAQPNDWVMVHDAVRPCLQVSDIEKLYQTLKDSKTGGILAAPVTDTVKKSNPVFTIEKTLDRQLLWRAQTPQMFRFALLKDALIHALENKIVTTDEAQAIELMGHPVDIVPTESFNIKITYPLDLKMAQLALEASIS